MACDGYQKAHVTRSHAGQVVVSAGYGGKGISGDAPKGVIKEVLLARNKGRGRQETKRELAARMDSPGGDCPPRNRTTPRMRVLNARVCLRAYV